MIYSSVAVGHAGKNVVPGYRKSLFFLIFKDMCKFGRYDGVAQTSKADTRLQELLNKEKALKGPEIYVWDGDSLYILNYNTQSVEITTQSSVTPVSVEARLDKES